MSIIFRERSFVLNDMPVHTEVHEQTDAWIISPELALVLAAVETPDLYLTLASPGATTLLHHNHRYRRRSRQSSPIPGLFFRNLPMLYIDTPSSSINLTTDITTQQKFKLNVC